MKVWTDLTETEQSAAVSHFEGINIDVPKGKPCNFQPTSAEFELDTNDPTTNRALRKRREPAESNGIPKSTTPNYQDMILKVKGDVVVVGDLEVPDHDADVLELAMAIGKKMGIHQLIINGDFIAADGLSPFPDIPVELDGFDTCKELDIACDILIAMSQQFTSIYTNEGNHDKRVRRATSGQLPAYKLFHKLLPSIQTTPFSQIHLTSGGKKWLICHPKNYSRLPGSVARDIAEIQQMNVVCAHTHHLSMTPTKCGQFWALDGGHCRDESRTLYKIDDVTRHPQWTPGFTVVKNGYGCVPNL